ncbi:Fe-S cluster assembly sulfur transfer protein SufU [Brochothrix campestris]|uniref:Fe-S cluster assembly sulfur transfer protein SufU n=1 Tax=Brochothrix campestris TaxID=2757 RepID=UPI0004B8E69A|nr:SUF system NifU family Fe-S cluster assembly protein [Brochothrix campestris]
MVKRNLDQLYRQVIIEHYRKPRNSGELTNETHQIEMNNPTCGDQIFLHLKVVDSLIEEAKFTGSGCSISIASASMMTETIKGHTIEQALLISDDFSAMMQGQPHAHIDEENGELEALAGVAQFPARIKCATLAWKAMEKALATTETNN